MLVKQIYAKKIKSKNIEFIKNLQNFYINLLYNTLFLNIICQLSTLKYIFFMYAISKTKTNDRTTTYFYRYIMIVTYCQVFNQDLKINKKKTS